MNATSRSSQVLMRDRTPSRDILIAEILEGLAQSPKQIPPKYFYDERGSRLFDRICEQPEYYPTRTETSILQQHGDEIAATIGADALLVEYGSGSSLKTRLLLQRLPALSAYVPVDISRSYLLECANALAEDFPRLRVLPVCADFTQPFELPREVCEVPRRVAFFPGSTIGNFELADAVALLASMRRVVGAGGGAIIGVDRVKPVEEIEAAYDDAAGVTAAFNRNVLHRLNREFGANFEPAAFEHRAPWIEAAGRIEMHLVARSPQRVTLADEQFEFAAGEHILTECCHKYTIRQFSALAARAGWKLQRSWTDSEERFGVHYLEGVAGLEAGRAD